MKHCGTCGNDKDESEFNKNKNKKDGLNTICKECSRKRSRKYYKENPDIHKQNVNKRKKRIIQESKERMLDYLSDKVCVDCGYSTNLAALQFDHVRGEKQYEVSELVNRGYPWKTILKEIKKCEIRCANCHAIKTATDFNWYTNISPT